MASRVLIAANASPRWVLHIQGWMFQPTYRGVAVNFRDSLMNSFRPACLTVVSPSLAVPSTPRPLKLLLYWNASFTCEDHLPWTVSSLNFFKNFLKRLRFCIKALYQKNVILLLLFGKQNIFINLDWTSLEWIESTGVECCMHVILPHLHFCRH